MTRCDRLAPEATQRGADRMRGGAAMIDDSAFHCQSAETHEQIGVFDDDFLFRGALEQVIVGANHARHDHTRCAQAVGVPRKCVSAKKFQEAVHLTLGMVKSAHAGPPVCAP
jgi:hypothetical protein